MRSGILELLLQRMHPPAFVIHIFVAFPLGAPLPYFKGKHTIEKYGHKLEDRYYNKTEMFNYKEINSYLKPKYQTNLNPFDLCKPYYDQTKGKNDVERKMFIDLNFWLPNDILLKADKMSMANSVELRVPFLDKEVWKQSRIIPTKYMVKDGQTKYIFRTIADEEEYKKAYEWTKKHCPEGFDKNPDFVKKSDEQKEKDWEFVVKMMVIIKDLMNGNDKLPKGCEEEAVGHNAIAAGIQGQRQWTDHWPNADFAEALLNTSFDWNGVREPYVLATENDVLNGISMLFEKLITNQPSMFSDVRTHWSAESVKRVTGYDIEGHAKEAGGFLHLINSGSSCA